MRRDALRHNLFTRRAAILASGQTLLLAAIGGRMYQLQILDSQRYQRIGARKKFTGFVGYLQLG